MRKIKITCTPCGAQVSDATTCQDCGCYFCDSCDKSHQRLGKTCREYIEMFTPKDAVKEFPMLPLDRKEREEFPNFPTSIPWDLVEPHRAMAMRNHDQTLERLAERGGLSPEEFYMIANGLRWGVNGTPPPSMKQAVDFIERLLEARKADPERKGS